MASRFPDRQQEVEPLKLAKEIETAQHYEEMQHLMTIVKRGKARGEIWNPTGVAIDGSTNQVYVTEGKFARVSIFSETGEFISTFSNKKMHDPWGITIHGKNIYITDIREHSVLHFKVSAEIHLFAKLGKLGSDIGQFNEPKQLAVSTDGDVFVTDSKNNRIQILDSELHYNRQIAHHSMKLPCDVELTLELVYVLSKCSPCVHVFSYTGDYVGSFITRGSEVGMQMTDPRFFCLDSRQNLIISDWGAHQIKIFSKEGTLIHTIGEMGQQVGMFYYPYGIALTDNLKLVVVSRTTIQRLKIFYL